MELTDVLDEYHVPYHTSGSKTRPGWLNLRCTRCGKDPYLGYNLAGHYFSCWNCGYVPVWEAIGELTQLPGKHIMRIVQELKPGYCIVKQEHKGKLKIPTGINGLSEYHRIYLKSRKLLPSRIVNQWEINGIGQLGGQLRWRIYIPIHLHGEVVSWTTRAIGRREPRYWSAKDEESNVPIDRLLYGVDHARTTAILCEGPVDVWAIGPGAVAVLGLQTTPARLEQLSRFSRRVICFDREPKAQERARQLQRNLSVFDGETINVVLESGKDPADADKSEIESLREFLQ